MSSALTRFNIFLRGAMELGIVAAFAYWGVKAGGSTGERILLGVGAPLLGFGFWGLVDFRRAGSLAEPLRLIQELAISGLAAAALIAVGQPALGWILASASILHHALVYLLGGKLIKTR